MSQEYSPDELFRMMVRDCLMAEAPQRIDNIASSSAAILIEELILIAKQSVEIYCNKFSAEVWGLQRILVALKVAVSRGVEIRVLTIQEPEMSETKKFLDSSQVCFRRLPAGISYNFMVVDGIHCRLEIDIKSRRGIAFLNDAKDASVPLQAFNQFYALAEEMNGGAS